MVHKEVTKIHHEAREQIVEVPHILHEERLQTVPQVQVAEAIKQVAKPHVQEVLKQIPKVEAQAVEKVAHIPVQLIHEVGVEVPHVMTHEFVTQKPAGKMKQRIVHTAEHSHARGVHRDSVVAHKAAAIQGEFYEAPVGGHAIRAAEGHHILPAGAVTTHQANEVIEIEHPSLHGFVGGAE